MVEISDINWLYRKYYSDNPELRKIVKTHSELVAKKALEINARKNLGLEPRDVYCAAMLHDIGVVKCDAKAISAHGELPYLCHGVEGEKMLIENGLEAFASVCATHTGAGISQEEIKRKDLPLPHRDLIPKTLLEKLICYADKFYSKGRNLKEEKTLEAVEKQMKSFGEDSYQRFLEMHKMFSLD